MFLGINSPKTIVKKVTITIAITSEIVLDIPSPTRRETGLRNISANVGSAINPKITAVTVIPN